MRIALFVGLIYGALMLSACTLQSRAPSESVAGTALCTTCLELCTSCHYMKNGQTAGPEIPKLAGQYDVFLVKAVENFKQGKRDSETMQRIASMHTEEDMKKLARYLASMQPPETPSVTAPDQALWEWGKVLFEQERVYGIACANCHGHDGMGYAYQSPKMRNIRAIPRLAGQNRTYLASAVQRYVDGKFEAGMCTMRKAGKTLSKNDVDSLVEYLSSLKP